MPNLLKSLAAMTPNSLERKAATFALRLFCQEEVRTAIGRLRQLYDDQPQRQQLLDNALEEFDKAVN